MKNGGFNELYGEDAEDAYYLVLSMKAPADFEAVKATLGNGNAADVNDGTFTLIQKSPTATTRRPSRSPGPTRTGTP